MKEQEIQENMNKSIEATQRNFNTIRTGRANASLLDRISVEYYGAETPIKSLATISTLDSQTISIQPFDISCLQAIEKSISMSDLGITPNNDGKVIFGSTVFLNNLDTAEKISYKIVGKDEADLTKKLIYFQSPIGKGLIGKNKGDLVEIKTPSGSKNFEIINVEYI